MPRKGDEIVGSIGLIAEDLKFFGVPRESAVRLAVDPDHWVRLNVDDDLEFVITRSLSDSAAGVGLLGLVQYKEDEDAKLVHTLPLPEWFAPDPSPLEALRKLCNECGITMRVGDTEARLFIRYDVPGRNVAGEVFLEGTEERVSQRFNIKDTGDGVIIALGYAIRWDRLKYLL